MSPTTTVSQMYELPTRRVGRRVLVYELIDSTNTRAMQLADNVDNDGLAILANQQEAGRGQHGRTWLAAPGSSVLLSVLLFPPPPLARPAILTAWAAVSVCLLVERLTGLSPIIKWPNDVLLVGRKVCGILIEQCRNPTLTATVAGIGLNVTQSAAEFAACGLPQATSLAEMGATGLNTHDVARQLLHILDEQFDRLFAGDHCHLQELWSQYLGLLGREVIVELLSGTRMGQLQEIDFDGIALTDSAGLVHVLAPETILHIQLR